MLTRNGKMIFNAIVNSGIRMDPGMETMQGRVIHVIVHNNINRIGLSVEEMKQSNQHYLFRSYDLSIGDWSFKWKWLTFIDDPTPEIERLILESQAGS